MISTSRYGDLEKDIQSSIILELGKFSSVRVFRNNVGRAVAGSQIIRIDKPKTVALRPGDWVVRNGRPVQFGLTQGSSDLIGWRTLKITPEMVGKEIAQFLGVEVKTLEGNLTTEQKNFALVVNANGGLAIVARSPAEAVAGVMDGELGL